MLRVVLCSNSRQYCNIYRHDIEQLEFLVYIFSSSNIHLNMNLKSKIYTRKKKPILFRVHVVYFGKKKKKKKIERRHVGQEKADNLL